MRQFLILLFLSTTLGCSKVETKSSLIGKWAGFENDTTYIEVWFTDSLFLAWNAEMYSHLVYSYRYDSKNRRIIVMTPYNREELNTIEVTFVESDSLELTDSKNSWSYYKIESEIPDLSEGRIDTIDFEIGMREKQINR